MHNHCNLAYPHLYIHVSTTIIENKNMLTLYTDQGIAKGKT
jgi:hypothetical protein